MVLGIAFMVLLSTATAAPSAKLWPKWQAHDNSSSRVIDHSAWNAILGRYIVRGEDALNRFGYSSVTPADHNKLQSYLTELSTITISDYNKNEQRAYWINLYNALTIQEILNAYPLQSIRDISPGLFSSGPWGLELITVEGEALTLDDIEHRILRPIWKDPRIHYAVNCASIGCPDLQPTAYSALNTEALLERGARDFINHPRGAQVVDGKLQTSSIYRWFEDDFGGNDRGVITHLRQYASAALKQALTSIDSISNHAYDWRLNGLSDAALTDNAKRRRGS